MHVGYMCMYMHMYPTNPTHLPRRVASRSTNDSHACILAVPTRRLRLMNQGKLTWILRTTRVVLRTDAKDGGFTAIVANVAQYELNDVRSIKQDSFSLAMEANAEALEKLEDEDKEEIEEKTMTQMMGIFYMLYSAKKDSDFNIFNENGNE